MMSRPVAASALDDKPGRQGDASVAKVEPSAISDRSGVTHAVRAQILATEQWNLLATSRLALDWSELESAPD
jgi:hypothetical protein